MAYKPDIIIKNNALQMAEAGADIFSEIANHYISKKNNFNVAVSGGSTPRIMHRLLGSDNFSNKISWRNINFFWVDERCVPFDDKNSNYGAMEEDLFNKLVISKNQIHPMPIDVSPENGEEQYKNTLTKLIKIKHNEFPVLDLIFLGIGTDGHTASLFPGHAALQEKRSSVVAVKGGNPNVQRLTMTYPIINNANNIVLLASGNNKAEIVRDVIEKRDINLPASGVIPSHGRLTWLLDKDAAALLPRRNNHE